MPDDNVPMGGSESTGGMPDQPETTTGQLSRNPDPPAPEQPAPSGTPDQGAQLQSNVDASTAAVNARIDAVRKSRDAFERSMQQHEQAIHDFQKTAMSNGQPPDSPPVQPTPLSQASPEDKAVHNQIGWVWPAIVGLGLMIAGGRGKNANATKFLIGGMLQSYAKGYTEKAREMRDQWWKEVQFQHQQIQERITNQREVLADQRYNLAQKVDILNTFRQEHADSKGLLTDDENGLKQAHKDLVNDQKALNKYQSEALKTKGALAQLMKDPSHRAWVARFYEEFNKQYGHYPTNDDEVRKAQDMLPFDTFMQYRKQEGKDNPESGKPYAMPTPQPPGQSDKDMEGASDAIGDMIH